MKKGVSIIVLTYNRFELLQQAIKKILKQTYENIEIIICDDNSSDNTSDIVSKIKDSRIKYLKNKENLGYFKNFENGFNHAKNEYIMVHSDDDLLYEDDYIEVCVSQFEKENNTDLIFSNWIAVDNGLKSKRTLFNENKNFTSDEFLENWTHKIMPKINFGTFIAKKNLFERGNVFHSVLKNAVVTDFSMIMKLALTARNIKFLDKYSYQCRIRFDGECLSNSDLINLGKQNRNNIEFPLEIYYSYSDNPKVLQMLNTYIEYIYYGVLSHAQLGCNEKNFLKLLNLNNFRKEDKIYIYGKGDLGSDLNSFLKNQGIVVQSFIDDHRSSDDTITYSELLDIKGPKKVIIATYKYKYIYNIYKKLSKSNDIIVIDVPQTETSDML